MIVDDETLDLSNSIEGVLDDLGEGPERGEIKPELMESVCEIATAPTHPRARPMAAESHLGARTQRSLSRIAAIAPTQTTERTGTAQPFDITSNPKGVYVPAMSR